jgi:homoserine kinase type II
MRSAGSRTPKRRWWNAMNLPMLIAYPPDLRPVKPPEPLGGAGGFSGSNFWRIDCSRGEFALHAWPVDGPDAARLGQIHRWLNACSDFPIVPIPEQTTDGRSFVSHSGRFWELTPWKSGRPSPSSPLNLDHIRRGFATIARIHRRLEQPRAVGPSRGIDARLRELDAFLAGTHALYENSIRNRPGDPTTELAARWLSLARRQGPALRRELVGAVQCQTLLQPCVRDLRRVHLLFDGDDLTGLIDFGAMDLDSVAGDLARLIGDWFPNDRNARAAALQAYESVRPLSATEHRLIATFKRANSLFIGSRWLRWRFVDERSFEHADAPSEGLRRSIEQMMKYET